MESRLSGPIAAVAMFCLLGLTCGLYGNEKSSSTTFGYTTGLCLKTR